MKISVSSYSFHAYVKEGKMTQLDCVKKAAELGFDGVEFIELAPNESPTFEDKLAYAAKIRAEAEKYGIDIVAYTVGANLYQSTDEENAKEVARVKRELDVAAALGAKILRHDVCYSEKHGEKTVSFERMLPTIAKNAREITEYAQTLGIRTCTENHGYVAQDSDRVEKLYNTVAHDNYGILIDVGNFACADEDSTRAVSRLASYAVHVHAKDFVKKPYGTPVKEGFDTRACNRLIACAVGDGDIPVEQCIAILKRAKYDGYVSIEFEGSEDSLTAIARGRERLLAYVN